MKEAPWGVSGSFAHSPVHQLRPKRGRLLRSTSVTESAEIIAISPTPWPEETTRALLLSEFDERFRGHRLSVQEAECALVVH